MSTKITVHITQAVLEASKNCSPSGAVGQNCAIGRAIHDLLPGSATGRSTIVVPPEGKDYYRDRFNENGTLLGLHNLTFIELPWSAVIFIRLFDLFSPEERVKMTPFSFDINIPDKIVDEINIDELKRIVEKCPSLSLA